MHVLFVGGLAHGKTAHVADDLETVEVAGVDLKAGIQRYDLIQWTPGGGVAFGPLDAVFVNSFVYESERLARICLLTPRASSSWAKVSGRPRSTAQSAAASGERCIWVSVHPSSINLPRWARPRRSLLRKSIWDWRCLGLWPIYATTPPQPTSGKLPSQWPCAARRSSTSLKCSC